MMLQLNDDGEIELTEIGADDAHVSNSYPAPISNNYPVGAYPNLTEETESMLKHNRAVTNNNHSDFNNHPDNVPRLRKPSGFTVRGNGGPRNRRVWVNIRQRAKDIKSKMPQVKDVNNIDKYSRLMFPLLFLIFNAWYWVYYSVLSQMSVKDISE